MDLDRLLSNFDHFLVDLWGVVWDGQEVFPEAIDFVNHLLDADKPLLFLSNCSELIAEDLVARLQRFANLLSVLGLSARSLDAMARPRAAVSWSTRNLIYFLVGAPIAFVGHALFLVPYQLTDWFASRPGIPTDIRSARKLLGGGVFYLLWCGLLALLTGWLFGIPAGIAAAVTLPLVALITLAVRERWKDGRTEVRRYLILRKTGNVRGRLLERRRELAQELEKLRREISGED